MTKLSIQLQQELTYNDAWQEELARAKKYKEATQNFDREKSAQAALRRLKAVRDGKMRAEA
jgi:hypothetical protein